MPDGFRHTVDAKISKTDNPHNFVIIIKVKLPCGYSTNNTSGYYW